MDWLLPAAGAIVVIGGAAATLRGAWRVSRRIHRLADALLGDPEARPPRPGVVERLDQIERRVSAMELEIHPNGGHSLHDKVTRIARVTGANEEGTRGPTT